MTSTGVGVIPKASRPGARPDATLPCFSSFTWSGVKSITRKAEWPDWIPPAEMLQRRPDLPAWLDQALARAVAVQPEERFGDAVELLFALERGMAGGAPVRARPRSLRIS